MAIRVESVTDLVPSYRNTKRILEQARTRAEDPSDRQTIGGMIRDVEFALEWLQHGRQPGTRRGIERRAAYERERPVDPVHLQAYVANRSAGGPVQAASVSEEDRERIEAILGQLSPRERDCYRMAIGHGLPYSEIAALLGITKSSVQYYVERADIKINRMIRGQLAHG
jgi:RNA polymerase sigma-70 factor (ECF subfamily)